MECIRKLCDAIDTSFDERISLNEITDFIRQRELPISEEDAKMMFDDARSGRGFVCERQMMGPLTHMEVAAAVKGRHCYDHNTKQWDIKYRPFRDHWIVLLMAVNKSIFALPTERIIPKKIKAQYELEEEIKPAAT
jgi:hypothetical protein